MSEDLEIHDEEQLDEELEELLESEEMPRLVLTRDHFLLLGLFVVSVVAFLYFVLPKLTGLQETWARIKDGDSSWLIVACIFEVLSFMGYVVLFRAVCIRGNQRLNLKTKLHQIDWRESYQITMAGLAATRLFAAGGAGGLAVTAWSLRRSGLPRRIVARRMLTFMILLYGVFAFSAFIAAFGLWLNIWPGNSPFGMTFVPAMIALAVIVLGLLVVLLPADFERRLGGISKDQGRFKRMLNRLATAPALFSEGVRNAISFTKQGDPGLLGAVAWWGFDIAVLWASFHAFGSAPPFAIIVLCYFLGMVANLLPLPGGIGGVEGGMIAAFIAFGVPNGLAIVAVLTYRGFAFWLPTIPGAIAYFQLRRTVSRWGEEAQAS